MDTTQSVALLAHAKLHRADKRLSPLAAVATLASRVQPGSSYADGDTVRQAQVLHNGPPPRWLLIKDVGHRLHHNAAAAQLQSQQMILRFGSAVALN